MADRDLQDLDTHSESPVTSICSDNLSNQTFIASFADGTVKIFDRRLEEEDAIVRSYSEHTSCIQNAKWHPQYLGRFFSARYVALTTFDDLVDSHSLVLMAR